MEGYLDRATDCTTWLVASGPSSSPLCGLVQARYRKPKSSCPNVVEELLAKCPRRVPLAILVSFRGHPKVAEQFPCVEQLLWEPTFGPNPTAIGRFRPFRGQIRRTLIKPAQTSPNLARFGQSRPNSTNGPTSGPELVDAWPNSAKTGQGFRQHIGQIWPMWCNFSTTVGQLFGNFRTTSELSGDRRSHPDVCRATFRQPSGFLVPSAVAGN